MENATKLSAAPADGQTLPGVILGMSFFVDRFIYFGARTVMYAFFRDYIGGVEATINLSMSYEVLSLAVLAIGLMADFLLEVRLGLAIGAALTGLGLLVMVLDPSLGTTVGLTLFIMGSALVRVTQPTYAGGLFGPSVQRVAGGFSLSWIAINLGALVGGFFYATLLEIDQSLLLLGFAILSLVHGAIMLGLRYMEVLPSPAKLIGAQQHPPLRQVVAIVVLVMMCAVSALLLQYNADRSGTWSLLGDYLGLGHGLLLILGVAVALLLVALAEGASTQRTIILVLMALTGSFGWATVELGMSLAYSEESAAWLTLAFSTESVLEIVGNLIIGLILVLGGGIALRGYSRAANFIFLGLCISVLGSLAFLGLPVMGGWAIVLAIPLIALSQPLWSPMLFATIWSASPVSRKGTSMGIMMAVAGIGAFLAKLFPTYSIYGGAPQIWPGVGLFLYASLAVVTGLLLWQRLRNYAGDSTVPGTNPFV